MVELEGKYIYPLNLQYIDDIFMTWKGNNDDLTTFLQNINKQHLTIRFDFIIHRTIPFLIAKTFSR